MEPEQVVSVEHSRDYATRSDVYRVEIADWASMVREEFFARTCLEYAAKMITEKWVADNYQDVAASINQKAVATMVMAEAGAKIRESLERNIPGRVERIVEKQVFQRGVLGGMKRLS